MDKIEVRRYKDGDASRICKIIKKDVLAENIKDYPKETIEHLINVHNEERIQTRDKAFHVCVLTEKEKVGIML